MKQSLLVMSGYLRQRYTRREQLLLLLCAALVLCTLLWMLVWQPLVSARAASESRLAYAADTLDQVNMLAAELESLRRSSADQSETAADTQPLPQALNNLSARTGIRVAALEPAADNRSAGMRFDAVSMPELLQWLAELYALGNMQVEQITIAPAGNSPTAGNTVNASLQIRSLP